MLDIPKSSLRVEPALRYRPPVAKKGGALDYSVCKEVEVYLTLPGQDGDYREWKTAAKSLAIELLLTRKDLARMTLLRDDMRNSRDEIVEELNQHVIVVDALRALPFWRRWFL